MRKTLFASMLAAGLVLPALAEDAGTIKLHSGWKLIQERVDKGVAYGTLWGVTSLSAHDFPRATRVDASHRLRAEKAERGHTLSLRWSKYF